MSHTKKIETRHDFSQSNETEALLRETCRKLGVNLQPWGKHKLYSSTETGYAVKLDGWRYPVILGKDGIAKDDYNGSWGEQSKLDAFMQRFTAEKAIRDARRKGYSVSENITDGRIKLTLTGGR